MPLSFVQAMTALTLTSKKISFGPFESPSLSAFEEVKTNSRLCLLDG